MERLPLQCRSLLALQNEADKQIETEKQTIDTANIDTMDRERYFELLRREMTKDNKRLRNPKRIIK